MLPGRPPSSSSRLSEFNQSTATNCIIVFFALTCRIDDQYITIKILLFFLFFFLNLSRKLGESLHVLLPVRKKTDCMFGPNYHCGGKQGVQEVLAQFLGSHFNLVMLGVQVIIHGVQNEINSLCLVCNHTPIS